MTDQEKLECALAYCEVLRDHLEHDHCGDHPMLPELREFLEQVGETK